MASLLWFSFLMSSTYSWSFISPFSFYNFLEVSTLGSLLYRKHGGERNSYIPVLKGELITGGTCQRAIYLPCCAMKRVITSLVNVIIFLCHWLLAIWGWGEGGATVSKILRSGIIKEDTWNVNMGRLGGTGRLEAKC